MNAKYLLPIGLLLISLAALMFFNSKKSLSSEFVAYQEYTEWKELHNKIFSPEEEHYKFKNFLNNKKRIETANALNTDFQLGLNQFSDMTHQEFVNAKLDNVVQTQVSYNFETVALPTNNLPKSVDWRTKGAVSPVMNEGQCGSTLFIVAKESCESINAIDKGKLLDLSAQQIQDCDPNSSGCCGGGIDDVEQYIVQYGLESEKDYPFKSAEQQCQYNASKVIFRAKTFYNVPVNDSDQLAAAVAQQPTIACINAGDTNFYNYKSGIITDCSPQYVDHCVLAVGYGTEKGVDYWILKNQWGVSWGESGYVRIKKEAGKGLGQCGITTDPCYPVM